MKIVPLLMLLIFTAEMGYAQKFDGKKPVGERATEAL